MSIEPYGGQLVDRVANQGEASSLRSEAARLPRIEISPWTLSDLYLIAVGGLSPLEGFMDRAAYESVVEDMRLPDGLPWSIPVVLPVTDEEADRVAAGEPVALYAPDGEVAAVVDVTGRFTRDREREAEAVFRTLDQAHPGVAAMYRMGATCVAGSVRYLYEGDITGFPADNLTPAQTRSAFADKGWETVVAFQTRNPIHRAHEYLQKCALEVVDGLLVHPLVGETKSDDIPAEVRMDCYRVILDHYYPADRVLLSVLPAAMRYAGPREAIFHSIMRRNYGCSHFIVGRDHAGVGDYYGTYDAQKIFDEIDMDALGIQPMKFEHAFYCLKTKQMATSKTSPSSVEDRVFLSGTKVREMLSRGESPPEEFTRPEIAAILMDSYRERSPAG
jgi:sulfate adenylyltransferase